MMSDRPQKPGQQSPDERQLHTRCCQPTFASRGRQVHEAVDRALAQHADAYARVHRVRSRRAGRVVFIELALSFEPNLTVAEVNRRIEALRDSLQREVAHPDVSILALAQ